MPESGFPADTWCDMAERDPLPTLHSVVHTYLATLTAIAECVGEACPPIGGPHRHRLGRLRTRLSFDASKEAVEQSSGIVRTELREYAAKASQYVARNTDELRRAAAGLEGIVRSLTQRQDFYASRLRQFAAQMETTPYPTDRDHLVEVVALQSAGLISCVESMTNETQSLLGRMQDLLTDVEQRLADTEITDAVTGLMNRREMERHIAARRASRTPAVRLLFSAAFDAAPQHREELIQQIAARLGSQTRHNDLLCRWSDREFVVLFHGSAEVAAKRGPEMTRSLTGRYTLDNGDAFDVAVSLEAVESASTAAAIR